MTEESKSKKKRYINLQSVVSVITALVFFGVYIYIASFVTERTLLFGIIMLVLCLCTLLILQALNKYVFARKVRAEEEEQHTVSDLARGLLGRLAIPVAICNEAGKIIWHNVSGL